MSASPRPSLSGTSGSSVSGSVSTRRSGSITGLGRRGSISEPRESVTIGRSGSISGSSTSTSAINNNSGNGGEPPNGPLGRRDSKDPPLLIQTHLPQSSLPLPSSTAFASETASPTNSGVLSPAAQAAAAIAADVPALTSNPNQISLHASVRLFQNAARCWDPAEMIDYNEISLLASYCTRIERFQPGFMLIAKNDDATYIGFVLAGEVKIVVNNVTVATMGAGSILGAQSFFHRKQGRSADVCAGEDLIMAVLRYETMQNIAEESPYLHVKLMQMLCVQAILNTQRQAMDRQRVNVPLFDDVRLFARIFFC